MDVAYVRLLFDYDRWANGRVFDRAAELPEADYRAPAGLSYGNVHSTLIHILQSEIMWLSRWKGEQLEGPLADSKLSETVGRTLLPTLVTVRERFRQLETDQDAFLAKLKDSDLTRPVLYATPEGQTYSPPLGLLIAHVINHGTQFRSEAGVALTRFGHSPGDLDFVVYLRQTPWIRAGQPD